jgi:hypothetical protein
MENVRMQIELISPVFRDDEKGIDSNTLEGTAIAIRK